MILPGTLLLEDWFTCTDLDSHYLLATSETDYANDDLCIDWIKHFEQQTAGHRTRVYRLLLLDGYNSHNTSEFIHYCDQQKIIPFCLPDHSTHLLQPLDIRVFQPYKHWHSEILDDATWTGCKSFNIFEFLASLKTIKHSIFKSRTIMSAFKNTGFISYNPSIVLSKLLEYEPRPTTPFTTISAVATNRAQLRSLAM